MLTLSFVNSIDPAHCIKNLSHISCNRLTRRIISGTHSIDDLLLRGLCLQLIHYEGSRLIASHDSAESFPADGDQELSILNVLRDKIGFELHIGFSSLSLFFSGS